MDKYIGPHSDATPEQAKLHTGPEGMPGWHVGPSCLQGPRGEAAWQPIETLKRVVEVRDSNGDVYLAQLRVDAYRPVKLTHWRPL